MGTVDLRVTGNQIFRRQSWVDEGFALLGTYASGHARAVERAEHMATLARKAGHEARVYDDDAPAAPAPVPFDGPPVIRTIDPLARAIERLPDAIAARVVSLPPRPMTERQRAAFDAARAAFEKDHPEFLEGGLRIQLWIDLAERYFQITCEGIDDNDQRFPKAATMQAHLIILEVALKWAEA